MFTVMKIRPNLKAGDYRDPGWYQAPAGSVAYPYEGEAPPAARAEPAMDHDNVPFRVRRKTGPMEH